MRNRAKQRSFSNVRDVERAALKEVEDCRFTTA
jgi:hypothetical protein